jgi:Mitochondrial K+-H+ exchange-related
LLRRIPFEEWALKSLPPLTAKRRSEIEGLSSSSLSAAELETNIQKKKIKVLFPGPSQRSPGLKKQDIRSILETLATERQEMHKRRMIGSLIGAPLTLPFALVPM